MKAAQPGGWRRLSFSLARWALAGAAALLAACFSVPRPAPPVFSVHSAVEQMLALLPADALLFGERHDAEDHHDIELAIVKTLAARDLLAALALEMADQGRSTKRLPRDASEDAARSALGWDDAGWPWHHYGPTVMAALRAGVPVIGANLPRKQMKDAMADPALDRRLPPAALDEQRQAIRAGHCDLLPEAQIGPMVRIQIARDRAMARTIEGALAPGRTVLLIAGAGHVRSDLGVPLHLTPEIAQKVAIALVDESASATDSIANVVPPPAPPAYLTITTPALPPQDHCASLR